MASAPHLVADLETLRRHLGIEDWVVLGVSWGTTLGLAYAHAHPRSVRALVLALVGSGSRREMDWITEGVGRIFPREWHRFSDAIPARWRHLRPVEAYAAWLADPDPAERERAAIEWCAWEDAHVSLSPGHQPNPSFRDPGFRMQFARLVTHYWRRDCFVGDALLRDAAKLDGIPGVLIGGAFDVSGPLETAYELSRRWRTSRLHVLEASGHGGGDGFEDAILEALERFAEL